MSLRRCKTCIDMGAIMEIDNYLHASQNKPDDKMLSRSSTVTALFPLKSKPAPEISQLWPHSVHQSEKIPIALNRLLEWKGLVDEMSQFSASIQSIEKEYAKQYERLAIQLQKPDLAFESSTGISLNLVQDSCASYAHEHTRFEQAVTGTCIRLLTELRVDIIKKIKSFKTEVDTLTRTVTRTRTSTITTITQHERAKARRIHNSSGTTTQFVDPWLTEQVLYKQLRTMITAEADYETRMIQVLKRLAEFDEKVVICIRRILVEYFTAREDQYDAMKSLLRSARTFLQDIPARAPFQSFTTATDLLSPSAWNAAPSSVAAFPYAVDEIRIARQAVLARRSVWVRGGWTRALYVVTGSGYLHCFKKVSGRVRGEEARRAALDRGSGSRGGWFGWGNGGGGAVVPPSREMMMREMEELPVYEDLNTPKAFFSVCLNNAGRVAVEVVADKAHLFIFAVDVYKSPRDPLPWKRHEIKANSEAEMVDWVAFLREMIESYFPERPPEPLFSAPHEIKERVERRQKELPQSPKDSRTAPAAEPDRTSALQWDASADFMGIDEIEVLEPQGDIPAFPAVSTTALAGPSSSGTITGRTFTASRKRPETLIAE